MAKAKKTLTTVLGTVTDISKEKTHNGDVVTNVDIRLHAPGKGNPYVDLAFWGMIPKALLQGKRLSDDGKKWVKFQSPIEKGTMLEATGNFVMGEWTPTKSKKLKGKVIKKGQIAIYAPHQIKLVQYPKL